MALMCVCVCGGHVSTHMCTSMWKPEVSLRFAPHAASKNRTGSFTGLELSKQARLAGKRAPGTYLSPYPQYWDYKQVAPCLASFVGSGDQTQYLEVIRAWLLWRFLWDNLLPLEILRNTPNSFFRSTDSGGKRPLPMRPASWAPLGSPSCTYPLFPVYQKLWNHKDKSNPLSPCGTECQQPCSVHYTLYCKALLRPWR